MIVLYFCNRGLFKNEKCKLCGFSPCTREHVVEYECYNELRSWAWKKMTDDDVYRESFLDLPLSKADKMKEAEDIGLAESEVPSFNFIYFVYF